MLRYGTCRRRALNEHWLACLSNTRNQVLSSRAQFDMRWYHLWAKLRQYDNGRPAWKQDGRADAGKDLTDGCEEMRIDLANVRRCAGTRGI